MNPENPHQARCMLAHRWSTTGPACLAIALLLVLAALAMTTRLASGTIDANRPGPTRVLPLANATYGGGSDPSRTQDTVALVSWRTNASRSALTLWIDVEDFSCRSDSEALFVVPRVVITARGTFSVAGAFRGWSASSTATVRASISGHFVRPDLATGTIEVANGTCTSALLTYFTGDPAASNGSGVRRAGGLYVGYFSQRSTRADVQLPFVFRLSSPGVTASGRALAGAAARVNLLGPASQACSRLDHFDQIWFDHPMSGTSFSDGEHFSLTTNSSAIATTTITWSGAFGAPAVEGSWQETSDLVSASRVTATCRTGVLHWQAIGAPG